MVWWRYFALAGKALGSDRQRLTLQEAPQSAIVADENREMATKFVQAMNDYAEADDGEWNNLKTMWRQFDNMLANYYAIDLTDYVTFEDAKADGMDNQ